MEAICSVQELFNQKSPSLRSSSDKYNQTFPLFNPGSLKPTACRLYFHYYAINRQGGTLINHKIITTQLKRKHTTPGKKK